MSHTMFQSVLVELNGLDVNAFVSWMDTHVTWWRFDHELLKYKTMNLSSQFTRLTWLQDEMLSPKYLYSLMGTKIEVLIPNKKQAMLVKLTWG